MSRFLSRSVLDQFDLMDTCDVGIFEWQRLKKMPRYTPGVVRMFGRNFSFADSCSLIDGLREIFGNEFYAFDARDEAPYIIDCGSNVGLSLLYFKRRYPDCRILSFEADPEIFRLLRRNIDEYGWEGVTARNEAVWNDTTRVSFRPEGGFSGRVALKGEEGAVTVDAIRLRELLDRPVDLLKVDIEGAEYAVMEDCRAKLGNVRNLFVEYHSPIGEKQVLGELLTILSESGFRYHLKEAYAVPRPFVDRGDLMGMDLQLNIFAFRQGC